MLPPKTAVKHDTHDVKSTHIFHNKGQPNQSRAKGNQLSITCITHILTKQQIYRESTKHVRICSESPKNIHGGSVENMENIKNQYRIYRESLENIETMGNHQRTY